MTAPRRPRGKSALFSEAPTADSSGQQPPPPRRLRPVPAPEPVAGSGRTTMFEAETGGRPWTVRCSSCRAETPVATADLVRRLFRFGSLWWPLGRYPHRIPCPACGDLTWCQVSWRPRPAS